MTLYIFGASDDLIEVEGLLSDELNPPYGKPARVVVKVDETVYASLWVEYDPDDSGEWRLSPGAMRGRVEITAARGEEDGEDEHGCPGYSDLATIHLDDVDVRRVSLQIEGAA